MEELRIANIFESEPLEASENKIKGIAVFVKLNIRIYLKILFDKRVYLWFFLGEAIGRFSFF